MRYCVLALTALALLQPAPAGEPNVAPAATQMKFEKHTGIGGNWPVSLQMSEDGSNKVVQRLDATPTSQPDSLETTARDDLGCVYTLAGDKLQVKLDGNELPPIALPAGGWTTIAADHLSFVFVGGKAGLVSLDPRKSQSGWLSYDKTELAGKAITALGVGPDGMVLAGTAEGKIYRVDRVEATPVALATRLDATGLGDKPIRAIHAAKDGSTDVVADGTLYRAAPAADAWQKHWLQVASMPYGAHDVYGAVLDGKLYIPGGMADHGLPAKVTYFKEMFVYDPNADTWTVTDPMTEALCYSGVAAMDKKIWVIGGGKNIGQNGQHKRVPVDLVHVYDPAAKTWQLGPTLPHAIMESVVVETGGRVYSIGGMDANEHRMTEVLSIAAGESKWRPEPNAPMGVQQASGCVIDGVIYVANMQTGLMAFDPVRGAWDANLPKTPDVTGPSAPLCTAYKGEVWLFGGYGNREVVEELPPASQPAGAKGTPKPRVVRKQVPLNPLTTWHYNPKTRSWAAGPEMPTPRNWGAAAVLNGHLYIAGGAYGSHGYYIFPSSAFMMRE